jgi:hypothetical protein
MKKNRNKSLISKKDQMVLVSYSLDFLWEDLKGLFRIFLNNLENIGMTKA